MKLGDVVRLEKVFGKMLKIPMTMAKAKKVSKGLKPFFEEIKDFNDVRLKGAQKYVTKGKDFIGPEDEGFENFMKELDELVSQEIGLDFDSFDEDDFKDLVVTPIEMQSIENIGLFKVKEA